MDNNGQADFDIPALRAKLRELLGADSRIYPVLIEQQFPRILDMVVSLWGKAGLDVYLEELMVTKRPDRKGFSHDVALEIFRLAAVHGTLGLTPKNSLGTAWDWVDDPELFVREFTNKQE